MKTSIQDEGKVGKKIEVEYPAEALALREQESLSEIARSASIRGFRRGKAPLHVVKRLYGEDVRQEAIKNLISEGIREVIQKEDLSIVAVTHVEPAPYKDGEPFRFAFSVEVMPTLEAIRYDGIEVWEPKTEVTGDDVSNQIERLREIHAEVAQPDPARPAQIGDVVMLGRSVRADGEWKPLPPPEGVEITLGKEMLPEKAESAVLGKSVGEIVEVELDPSEEGGEKHRLRLSVRDIKERRLPAPDDDFAKDVGIKETFAELTEHIRKSLEEEARSRDQGDLNRQILKELCLKNPIDLPVSLVDEKVQDLIRMYGLDRLKTPLNDDVMSRLRERATELVHQNLLIREIKRIDKIEITDQEVEAEIAEEAKRTGDPVPKVKARIEKEGGQETLRWIILEKKLFELLKTRITIHQGPPPQKETAGKEGPKGAKDE